MPLGTRHRRRPDLIQPRRNTRITFEQIIADITPTCDVGHPDGTPIQPAHGTATPCHREAAYTLRLHDCDTGQAGHIRAAIWCRHHLDKVLILWSEALAVADTQRRPLACAGCLMRITTIQDVVWDVTPIRG